MMKPILPMIQASRKLCTSEAADIPNEGLAVGKNGKPCYRITPREKGETTTVLAAFTAARE